jgi:hypothetical protein
MGGHREADYQERNSVLAGRRPIQEKTLNGILYVLKKGCTWADRLEIWILHNLLAETQEMAMNGNLGENLEETASNAG